MDYKQSGHGQQVNSIFTLPWRPRAWEAHTSDKKAPGDLPMGMTTPKTATVRFSPRRKCSLPAEEGEQERDESEKTAWRERLRVRKRTG